MRDLPVFGDVEGPLKLQVLVLVIIHEGGDGGVVTASEHASWSILLGDYTVLENHSTSNFD